MNGPRITHQVIAEVNTKLTSEPDRVLALQLIQRRSGKKRLGLPSYRFVNFTDGVLNPIRGQGVSTSLDRLGELVERMKVTEKNHFKHHKPEKINAKFGRDEKKEVEKLFKNTQKEELEDLDELEELEELEEITEEDF